MRLHQRFSMVSGHPRSRSSALSQASGDISEMLLLIRASTMRALYLRAISRRSPSLRLQLSFVFMALAPTCWRTPLEASPCDLRHDRGSNLNPPPKEKQMAG